MSLENDKIEVGMRVLVPIDFSDNARKALDYALTLFGDHTPEVVLLNTWQIPHTGVGMLVSIEDILRDEAERTMEEWVADVKTATKSLFPVSGKVQPGALPDVVRSILRNESFDYVVMGTHGADDLKKKLLGSNTANVVRSSTVPVLVVPLDVEVKMPTKIALATDFKSITKDTVRPILRLVEKFNARFELVHVESSEIIIDEDAPKGWQEPFGDQEVNLVQVVSDNIVEGVDRYVNEGNVSLLAAIRHDYGFFEGLFHKSVSRQLSMVVDCPLLIIPH